jgi:hypothetical protein
LIKHTFLSIANGGEHSLPLRIIKIKKKKKYQLWLNYLKWDMNSSGLNCILKKKKIIY